MITLRAFGTPNVAAPSFAQCRGPRDVGFNLTFGEEVGSPEDIPRRVADDHRRFSVSATRKPCAACATLSMWLRPSTVTGADR